MTIQKQARHPQTNGICERFYRTIQEDFYAIAFRKKIYNTLEELQENLDKWLDYYNNERTHTGKYCLGKTPMQTWIAGLHLAKEKMVSALYPKVVSLPASDEEETGSAGEYPARNSLTDWNGQKGQNPPAIPMTIPRNYVLENPY